MELSLTAQRNGRLSSFLRGELAMSAGLVNKLKWVGALLVNGAAQHTDYQVQPGDVITVVLDEPEPAYPAENGTLTVLFEDEHLLAVDKPAGMLIHPSRAQNQGTLANIVAGYYRRTGQKCAFHPVTRLDRDTFGIVLLAKNAHIHGAMTLQQSRGQIRKRYHGLVYGCPETERGIIDAPIARKPLPSLLREISRDGKPSQTEFQILERYDGYTGLELQPITGRTHQLRLHCAYIGCPILGDPQYASPESQAFSRRFFLKSQILCARTLEFIHPITGENMFLSSRMDALLKCDSNP